MVANKYMGISIRKMRRFFDKYHVGYGLMREGITMRVSKMEFIRRINAEIDECERKAAALKRIRNYVAEHGE